MKRFVLVLTGRDNHFTQETKVQVDRKYRSKRSREEKQEKLEIARRKDLFKKRREEKIEREYCMEAVVG